MQELELPHGRSPTERRTLPWGRGSEQGHFQLGNGLSARCTSVLQPGTEHVEPGDGQLVRFYQEFHGSVFLSRQDFPQLYCQDSYNTGIYFGFTTMYHFNLLLQPLNCSETPVTGKCSREEPAGSFPSWVVCPSAPVSPAAPACSSHIFHRELSVNFSTELILSWCGQALWMRMKFYKPGILSQQSPDLLS